MVSEKDKPLLKISVVIAAYNRKKFLLTAVNSVLNQTLEAENYEVIVIKNFKDDEIDMKLGQLRVMPILVEEPVSALELIQLGISASKNEIVAFLDDDDQFEKEKLETVFKAFNQVESLVYYHCGFKQVDEMGNLINNSKFDLGKLPNHPLIVEPPSYGDEVVYYDAGFNMSSICILKKAIEQDRFKKLKVNPDLFMLFSAMKHGGKLMIDNKILTIRCVHQSNFSLNLGNRRESYVRQYSETYYQIMDMIKDRNGLAKLLRIFMGWSILRVHGISANDKNLLWSDLLILWRDRVPYLLKRQPAKAPFALLTSLAILLKIINAKLGSIVFNKFDF